MCLYIKKFPFKLNNFTQNVREGVDAIYHGEQLINHGVMHSCASTVGGASLFADGIHLIEDDDM